MVPRTAAAFPCWIATACTSNSAILSNNYVSLLSDRFSSHAYKHENGVTNEAIVIEWAAAGAWWRLGDCEKAMGWCTARCKMLLFCAKTIMGDWGDAELARLKKEEEERKTICPFCEYLVWYFRDGFSRREESCWSWKHSKMNGMWL